MKKLFVAGCSVSDYTKVDKVYGEYLAEALQYEYVHEAAGCGSNFRMWRRITGHIMNGNLTSDDLLVIQYTGFERREIWSRHLASLFVAPKQVIREPYDDGEITRFKVDSYTWQNSKSEILVHKMFQNNCLNAAFDKEIFDTQHLMFQCLLKEYNIQTIFLGAYVPELKLMPPFDQNFVGCHEIWLDINNCIDEGHFNDKGHQLVAEKILNKINERK